MNRRNREINIISVSALDLFASALGVFLLLTVLSMASGEKVDEMELCFVVDFTGSMSGTIDQLADSLEGMVRVLQRLSPRLVVGVVAYRDRADEVFVTRAFPLSAMENPEDVKKVVEWLRETKELKFGKNPDTEEAVDTGLQAAVEMPWSSSGGTPQVIVVVGDARAYPEKEEETFALARQFVAGGTQRKVSAIWCDTIRRGPDPESEARAKAIGATQQEFFKKLADAGKGQFQVADRMLETVLLSVLDQEQ